MKSPVKSGGDSCRIDPGVLSGSGLTAGGPVCYAGRGVSHPGTVFDVNRFLLTLLLVVLAAGCREAASTPSTETVQTPPVLPESPPVPETPVARVVEGNSPGVPVALPSESPATPATPAADRPEPVYRPDDNRPRHDDARLEQAGIRRYGSRRLILYSDVDAARVARLPALVDALYDELIAYFGELPPARDGSDFQITGYLIGDADRFVATGLVPGDLPSFDHGRHRGREFWIHDQKLDYYRAHLLLHEVTHCFMTALPRSNGPVWYMEGMAEHFASHRLAKEAAFRILPASPDETPGFSRIDRIREAIAAGDFLPIEEVFAYPAGEFKGEKGYEWSWAACQFLDSHPRYRDRFREMGDPRLRDSFAKEFRQRFAADSDQLRLDWALFAHGLCYGYEMEPAVLEPRAGTPLAGGSVAQIEIAPNRGWQSAGVRVEAGAKYEITAEGTFTLADEPKPWLSDAGGISFDYAGGHPIGLLLAAVLTDSPSAETDSARGLLTPIVVGRAATITAPAAGTLYLRINDGWDRVSDNRGRVVVNVRRVEE